MASDNTHPSPRAQQAGPCGSGARPPASPAPRYTLAVAVAKARADLRAMFTRDDTTHPEPPTRSVIIGRTRDITDERG